MPNACPSSAYGSSLAGADDALRHLVALDIELRWPYWSVDLPGLTEAGAERLIAPAEGDGLSLGGSSGDPRQWFTVHVDVHTVRSVLRALQTLEPDALSTADAVVVEGITEDLQDWLSEASGDSTETDD